MAYRIDPANYCAEEGCTRPKVSGEDVCSQCSRLARAAGRSDRGGVRELAPEVDEFLAGERKLPRCIAYLSLAGDVITLELTGEPKFTEADVEAVAAALSNRRMKAA